jgi:hypothetical protein
VLLLVEGHHEESPEGGAAETAWLPRVGAGVGADGASVSLGWRF